ncbi:MAG: ABC-F family ATP-binding cassette domain-containing protein [Chloroflexi bacterium]|nr:MAG: ABC-F family ATP-binding cassette domain-containing protein [Chloroflexota bacterium]TMG18920.1 MAG: ABC-F family ATP-binding cassette domain-containing protein [Chloroflexota bacterium]TMG51059.1 MAG: ABC-F family ATP-binding cassette domain-containing protein [Chloroflexota bacterium]
MPLLRVENLTLMYGATEVLAELTFQVEPRQRLGIVGANGSGKSSLLRAISGELTPAAGSLTLSPRARTAYLAQELEASPHESVYADALHSRKDIIQRRERLTGLETAMSGATGAALAILVEEYGDIQHEYERLDGYAYDNRVAEVLFGVGLTEADQALPPSALSGGQRRRLALARLLLQDADLLLLDEPTNHLDLEAIEWLEGFLRLSRSGMLIVSHDRRFLEHTTDDILELQAAAGEWYPGNYRQYLRLRRERRTVRQKEYEAQQDYIARTEEFIRRYKAGQRAREARGRQTKLDRLERLAPPADDQQIRIRLQASSTSELIFQSDGLELVYPGPSGKGSGWGLSVPGFTVTAGERVAIVGPNGSGKTSLLKALLGELRPRRGRVKTGPRVTMRYYDQHLADLDPSKTVLTELQDAFGLPEETLRTFLGRLLFSGDDAFKTIRSLSGGEKSRVALAKLMLDDAGLLLLDEPTNHLDIPAQEMLEEALQDFEGTIVFVSHDRYFIDAIATRLWVIDDGAVTLHLGNYSDLERRRQREPRPGGEAARPRRADQVRPVDRQAEGSSTTGVEDRIDELEGEVRRIEEQLADHQTYDDPARVAELARAHEDASGRLRALYQEWEQAAGE